VDLRQEEKGEIEFYGKEKFKAPVNVVQSKQLQ
jgi:hypothetical protein